MSVRLYTLATHIVPPSSYLPCCRPAFVVPEGLLRAYPLDPVGRRWSRKSRIRRTSMLMKDHTQRRKICFVQTRRCVFLQISITHVVWFTFNVGVRER